MNTLKLAEQRPVMGTVARQFAEAGYAFVPSLLDAASVRFFYQCALQKAASGVLEIGDDQVPGTPCAYGDPMTELLLVNSLARVAEATGIDLYPTYSYFRVYKRGDELGKHTDRPSCEISVSLSLGQQGAEPWPLWIEGPRGTFAITLAGGDGVVYRGIECPHWREPFRGDHCAQVFLHYVDQHGPHAEWRFDKRGRLGLRSR